MTALITACLMESHPHLASFKKLIEWGSLYRSFSGQHPHLWVDRGRASPKYRWSVETPFGSRPTSEEDKVSVYATSPWLSAIESTPKVYPVEAKVRVVEEAPAPNNVTELQAYTQLVYSIRAITQVTSEESVMEMGERTDQSASVLVHYDPKKKLTENYLVMPRPTALVRCYLTKWMMEQKNQLRSHHELCPLRRRSIHN